jgi:S1-C subfamily serine protease
MPTSTVFAQLSDEVAGLAARLGGSIVQVHGRPRRPASGLVIAPDRVVTTSHSVEWEDHTKIRLADGRTLDAELAGRDAATDLVLLRVPGLEGAAPAAAEAAAATGHLAVILGRTWTGRLQARLTTLTLLEWAGRGGPGGLLAGHLLDVGPYPGFSGSAVFLPDGRLAGIATAGLARGAGLSLPAHLVRGVVDALERHGTVRRGFLGITSQPVHLPARQRGSRSEETALLVVGVSPGAPADQAGLLVGDVLVAFDGTTVDEPERLLRLLTGDLIGRTVPLTLLRAGQPTEVTVTVGDRPSGD